MDCVLRPWQEGDAGDLAAVLNDRSILDNLREMMPRVLRIRGSIAHVRGEGGNGHQSLSTMHQDGRSTAYKSEYSIFKTTK